MLTAITGGIGSGKTFVSRLLRQRGIEIFDCDASAKRLMRSDQQLQRQLTAVVGEEVFPGGVLDKALLWRFIVASDSNAQLIDDVVHPAVALDFLASGCQWLESAILFESGFVARIPFDYVVCVTAPFEVRLARVMERDGISREKALEWIRRQMPQDEKARRADFVIVNDGSADLDEQIEKMLQQIKTK